MQISLLKGCISPCTQKKQSCREQNSFRYKTNLINRTIQNKNTNKRIRKGVINPNDPKEKETTGGTGPLNMDAACRDKKV